VITTAPLTIRDITSFPSSKELFEDHLNIHPPTTLTQGNQDVQTYDKTANGALPLSSTQLAIPIPQRRRMKKGNGNKY